MHSKYNHIKGCCIQNEVATFRLKVELRQPVGPLLSTLVLLQKYIIKYITSL